MIASILPPGVEAAEMFGHTGAEPLFAEEAAALRLALPARREEFSAGRSCARQAMAKLGVPPAPLPPGPDRQPLWPGSVAGSITHCPGYCAAAVAHRADFASLGIDAEPHAPLPGDTWESVTRPEERDWLRRQPDSGVCWDRLLFSAKEAFYKAWFPLTRHSLEFDDVRIEIAPHNRTFRVVLQPSAPLTIVPNLQTLSGVWLVSRGLVVCFAGLSPAVS